jgi:hypothetical protein
MSDNPSDPECVAAALEALAITLPDSFYDLPLSMRIEVALRPPPSLAPAPPLSDEDMHRWNAVRSTLDDILADVVPDELIRETGNVFGASAASAAAPPSPTASASSDGSEPSPGPFAISGIRPLPDSDASVDSLPIHADWRDTEADDAMEARAAARAFLQQAAVDSFSNVLPIVVPRRGTTPSVVADPGSSSSSSDCESVVSVIARPVSLQRAQETLQGAIRRPAGATAAATSTPAPSTSSASGSTTGLAPLPTFGQRQTRLEHLAALSVRRGRERISALQAVEQQEAAMVRQLSEISSESPDPAWMALEAEEEKRRTAYLAAVATRREKVKDYLDRPVQKRIYNEAEVSRAVLLASGGSVPVSDPARRAHDRSRPTRALRSRSPAEGSPAASRRRTDAPVMSAAAASAWAEANARAAHEARLQALNIVPLFSMLRDYELRDDIVDEEVVNSYRCCVRFWKTCPFCGSRWSGARTSATQLTHCMLRHCEQWLHRDPLAPHCIYPPCVCKVGHLVAVCPTLHRLCDSCGTRGHAANACGDQLEQMATFERFKELGLHTRKPKDWGFFGPLMPASYLRLYRANGLSLWMNWPGGPVGFQAMGARRRGEVIRAAIWE